MSQSPIYQRELHGAGMWSQIVSRDKILRLTALDDRSNVGMVLYNALERDERYNMPDTLKGQQVFHLSEGCCLHSDMGRILASVVRDTNGWHDTVCGASDPARAHEQFGERSYLDARNDWVRNARDCFLIELGKWGLDERSLVPNLNWFSKVVPDEKGRLRYVPGAAPAGSVVELRLDLDCLVVLNTCPHPLDPSEQFPGGRVHLEVFEGTPAAADDPCRLSHPENGRAFQNNDTYHTLRFR